MMTMLIFAGKVSTIRRNLMSNKASQQVLRSLRISILKSMATSTLISVLIITYLIVGEKFNTSADLDDSKYPEDFFAYFEAHQ